MTFGNFIMKVANTWQW